jgi:hypothetical protein
MTALSAQPPISDFTPPPATGELVNYAKELRKQTLACRVRHFKMGTRKSLSREQIARAANQFDAESDVLSAAKKLFDTSDPSYREVVRVRTRATEFWKSQTVPYPEPGIRLIRRERVEHFDKEMRTFRDNLRDAVAAFQERYGFLRTQAEQSLGTLFNAGDYPIRVDGEFAMEWDFPSIEPPGYLKNLHPHLYAQESQRINARFEEAVRLTEQAFTQRFQELIAHLAERLSGNVDGKPKIFRDTAVENLKAFFDEFRSLNVGSSVDLDQLVTQAQSIVGGLNPDALRESTELRANVAEQLTHIQTTIDGLMVARPRRAISLEEEPTS